MAFPILHPFPLVSPDCPFCQLDQLNTVRTDQHAIAFRDRFPVSHGHTLVIPRSHVESLYDAPSAERRAVWQLVEAVRAELARELRPDGFTIGINDGAAAGQTVGHAHVHIIPRYSGDVPDPRGGIRWVIPQAAPYWSEGG
jgi:diadenosine tetraphosphate (Ap4A) HIT family hydrolase